VFTAQRRATGSDRQQPRPRYAAAADVAVVTQNSDSRWRASAAEAKSSGEKYRCPTRRLSATALMSVDHRRPTPPGAEGLPA
jgi:hypothetical protein